MNRTTLRFLPLVAVTLLAAGCPKQVGQPVAIGTGPGTVAAGSIVLLDASQSTDPSGRELYTAWSFSSIPAGSAAQLKEPASLKPSFVADLPGDYVVRLVVSNGVLASDPVLLTITASQCGVNAPVTGGLTTAPASPGVGSVITLTAPDAADADNEASCGFSQALAYHWWIATQPPGSTAQLNNSGLLNPSFVADVAGQYGVRLVLTDSTGRTSSQTEVSVTVAGVACGLNPPVATVSISVAVPPQVSLAGPFAPGVGSTVQLAVAVADQDDPSTVAANATLCTLSEHFTYAWSLRALPSGSRAALTSENGANPSFSPDLVGTYVVEVVATDHAGLRSVVETPVVVACGSSVPQVVAMGATSTSPLVNQMVTLSGTLADADVACGPLVTPAISDSLTYSWTVLAAPAGSSVTTASLSSATASAPSFRPDVAGHYQLGLVAISTKTTVPELTLRSEQRTLDLTAASCGLNAPSVAPSATVGASSTNVPDVTSIAVNPGDTVHLSAHAADADNGGTCLAGQSVSVVWAVVSRPAASSAVLSSLTDPAPAFALDVPGAYQLSVTASDSSGLSSPAAYVGLLASTCGFVAPSVVASALPSPAALGGSVTLTAVATGHNGESCAASTPYTYVWRVLSRPAGSLGQLSSSFVASPTFTPDVIGVYGFGVTTTDSFGQTSPEAGVTVSVGACTTRAPSVSFSPQLTGTTQSPITLSNAVVTGQNCMATPAAYTYAWSFLARPAFSSQAFFDNPAALAPEFTPDMVGSYSVQLVATDSLGNAGAAVQTITVTSCGTASPTLAAITFNAIEPDGTASAATAHRDDRVSFATTVTDPNPTCGATVQPYSYEWALLSRPAASQAQLDSGMAASPSFFVDAAGTYKVQVVVTDALGNTSLPKTYSLVTSACGAEAPTVVVSYLAAQVGASSKLPYTGSPGLWTAIATDKVSPSCPSRFQATSMSFAWQLVAQPTGSTAQLVGTSTGSIPVTAKTASSMVGFTSDQPGPYQVVVIATTNLVIASLPTPGSFTADMCGANPPSLGALTVAQPYGPGQSNNAAGDLYANYAVTFHVPISDPDNGNCTPVVDPQQQLSVQWSLKTLPLGSSPTLRNANTLYPSFTPDQMNASWWFQQVVTDSTGRATTALYQMQTNGCGGAAPVAWVGLLAPVTVASTDTPSTATVITKTPVQVEGMKSADADNGAGGCSLGQTLSYHWTFSQLPPGSRVTLNDPALADPSFTPDVDGAYVLSLLVSDNTGLVSTPNTVTVTATSQGNVVAPGAGPYSSVATDADGVPSILYYDNQGGTLSFIRCTANCSTALPTWSVPVQIDSGLGTLTNQGGTDARPIDLKISGTNIYAAYHFLTGGNSCGVKVAASADGVTWAKTTIESATNCTANGTGTEMGRWLSLALGPDKSGAVASAPAVAYYKNTNTTTLLRYALCNDTAVNCVTTTNATYNKQDVQNGTLSANASQGLWPSLRFTDKGHPSVAYFVECVACNTAIPANVNSLAYAEDTTGNGIGANWTASNTTNPIVDSGSIGGNDVGRYASLELVAAPGPTLNQPRIAYRDENNNWLKYAKCDADCMGGTGNWTKTVIDSNGDVGRFSSLALDPATGKARVAYYDRNNKDLRYASQANLAYSTFTLTLLDNASNDVGQHASLALSPQGNPRMSYFDVAFNNVKFLGFGP